MHLEWSEKAWSEYTDLQSKDKLKIKKVNSLIKDIMRNGVLVGIGNPEALKDNLQGYYSRHINDKDRLIYKIENDSLIIAQCNGHYNDK